MQYCAILLRGHKAQRDITSLRGSPSFQGAQQLNDRIKQTLDECWQKSGEDYDLFQEFVISMEEDIYQAIDGMEQLLRLGSCVPSFPQGRMGKPVGTFSRGSKGSHVMVFPQGRIGSSSVSAFL